MQPVAAEPKFQPGRGGRSTALAGRSCPFSSDMMISRQRSYSDTSPACSGRAAIRRILPKASSAALLICSAIAYRGIGSLFLIDNMHYSMRHCKHKRAVQMARDQIYLLVAKVGLSKDEQMKLIRKVTTVGRAQEIYVDDLTLPYRRKKQGLEQLDLAIAQMRPGDRLVIPTPGCLGQGREDIRKTLHRLQAIKCPILVASTGKTILWSNEAADALEFLELATLERKRGAAAEARKHAVGLGYKPAPKELKMSEDQARLMWHDRVRYPSGKEVAELCGMSPRGMYDRFGPRIESGPLARKRRRKRK